MARAKTRRNGPASMGDDQFEAIDDVTRMYDTGPAGTIPATLRRDDPEPPYLVQRAGRSPTVSPAGRVTDHDFRTSTSERKGLGGRATVGKYGVQYLTMSKRSYSPITLEVMQRRYVRIDKDIEFLNRKGAMRSQSPQKMTPEDIANFLVYRQELGVTNSDLMHDIAGAQGGVLDHRQDYRGRRACEVPLPQTREPRPQQDPDDGPPRLRQDPRERGRRRGHRLEEEIGYDFDLRMCRRTYGQRLIDRGIGINVVSKVLGHNSTNTMERYCCRLDDMDAVMTVAKALSADLPGPDLLGESSDSSAGDRPQEFESVNGVTDTDTGCPPLGGE